MNPALDSRQRLERMIAAGQADTSVYLALASACSALADHRAAIAAVDHVLSLQPKHVRALIIKGDQLAALSEARAASSFYRAAVDWAPPEHEMPAEMRDEVARAKALCAGYTASFETHLRQHLPLPPRQGTRFSESIDILVGRKEVYFQEPRQYFFPGLPQIQFYENSVFPWLERLQAATADIRGELLQVLAEDSTFQPYLQRNSRLPHTDAQGLLDNPAWSAFYLWKHGEIVPQNAARCPKTVAAMADIPLARIKNRSPSVLFSLLKPGAHIPPHTGEMNIRLICHLPLIVPENCNLRVGNDIRRVVEGKAWVFDDTIQHEAWNGSPDTRVILLFEIWRPELSADERALVGGIFDAIESYGISAAR